MGSSQGGHTLGMLTESDKTHYYQEVKAVVNMVIKAWDGRELKRAVQRQERLASGGMSDTDNEMEDESQDKDRENKASFDSR